MAADRETFQEFLKTMNEAKKSNSEAYDKAILSLSSAGLALSLSFHSTVVPIGEAVGVGMLKLSWVAFLFSIISTIVSFRLALLGLDNTIKYITEKHFGDPGKANDANRARSVSICLDWFSGFCFIAAVASLVIYVFQNV